MHAHDEVHEIVSALKAQMPQAQSQTGSRGAAPAVDDHHLTSLATTVVSPALRAFDTAAAAAPDPDKKAKRKAFFDALIKEFIKVLPLIIGGIAGAAPQAAPEGD